MITSSFEKQNKAARAIDIHFALSQTIAEHRRIMDRYHNACAGRKDIHMQLKESISDIRKTILGYPHQN